MANRRLPGAWRIAVVLPLCAVTAIAASHGTVADESAGILLQIDALRVVCVLRPEASGPRVQRPAAGSIPAQRGALQPLELEPVVTHVWIGLSTQLQPNTQITYTLNCQTAEIRRGLAARDLMWGAMQFNHRF